MATVVYKACLTQIRCHILPQTPRVANCMFVPPSSTDLEVHTFNRHTICLDSLQSDQDSVTTFQTAVTSMWCIIPLGSVFSPFVQCMEWNGCTALSGFSGLCIALTDFTVRLQESTVLDCGAGDCSESLPLCAVPRWSQQNPSRAVQAKYGAASHVLGTGSVPFQAVYNHQVAKGV